MGLGFRHRHRHRRRYDSMELDGKEEKENSEYAGNYAGATTTTTPTHMYTKMSIKTKNDASSWDPLEMMEYRDFAKPANGSNTNQPCPASEKNIVIRAMGFAMRCGTVNTNCSTHVFDGKERTRMAFQ